jgi:hypothetical protein
MINTIAEAVEVTWWLLSYQPTFDRNQQRQDCTLERLHARSTTGAGIE